MIELVVTVCLAGLPSSCMTVHVPLEAKTETACWAESQQVLAITVAAHPSWIIQSFACAEVIPGRDA